MLNFLDLFDRHPALAEAGKATPAAGYVAANFAGITLPTIINIAVAVYSIGLAVQTLWRGYSKLRDWWSHRYYYRALRKINKHKR
jgi:hypothetical protein